MKIGLPFPRSISLYPEIVRQQIFLDPENFGPGMVDGYLGEFTRKGMVNYRQAKSLPADWPPSSATAKPRHVFIGLSERILSIYENGRLIAKFPITPGSAEHPAPAGKWRITGAVPFPWFRYDLGILKRGERTDGFHSPPHDSDTTGLAESHGCIRLSSWDAATSESLS